VREEHLYVLSFATVVQRPDAQVVDDTMVEPGPMDTGHAAEPTLILSVALQLEFVMG